MMYVTGASGPIAEVSWQPFEKEEVPTDRSVTIRQGDSAVTFHPDEVHNVVSALQKAAAFSRGAALDEDPVE